jgi:hypothetical protein
MEATMIRALILCVALASCAQAPLSPEERAERMELGRAFLASGGFHVQPVQVPFYAMPPIAQGGGPLQLHTTCSHYGNYTYCN